MNLIHSTALEKKNYNYLGLGISFHFEERDLIVQLSILK